MDIQRSYFVRGLFFMGFSLGFYGCDFFAPQKKFTIAVPQKSVSYTTSAIHLMEFLESDGYQVDIVYVGTAFEANSLVASGKADLTFIMNHSHFIPEMLDEKSGMLRTILPLFRELMFFYTSNSTQSDLSINQLRGKRIGVEILNGETHTGLKRILQNVSDSVIFTEDEDADIKHFWGTYYGKRSHLYDQEGFKAMSMSNDWVQYLTVTNPSLSEFSLFGVPESHESRLLNTVETQILLVGSSRLGQKAAHDLAKFIYGNKLRLLKFDRKYSAIDEENNIDLLYPLHFGVDSYLRREEPTFLERYSETITLIITLIAISFGGFQTLRNRIAARKRDQVMHYFNEFISIRENASIDALTREDQLETLFRKLLVQMTRKKIEKGDFDTLSRLIQQELTNSSLKKAGSVKAA